MPGFVSRIGGFLRNPRVAIPAASVGSVAILGGGSWLIFRSWLVALVLALVIVLIVLLVVLLRTIFKQEREERLARGIEDRPAGDAIPAPKEGLAAGSDLEGSFRRALTAIRSSRLGPEGVYALPWILVVGESGAGKSQALRDSGLELPPEYDTLPPGPTRDCDWWLTNQAVALDTTGRYVESEAGAGAGEWRELLGLLRRHRPGQTLNGLVVAVPASSLLGRGPAELQEQAHTLRRRINELTDTLGLDVPIYVVVTKADLIEGFTETVSSLPPDRLREALGWTNDRRNFADAGELSLAGIAILKDRLEHLLPEMVLREADPLRRRRIFLFPQELEGVARTLADFLRSAFAPSVYGEVPFLRGVYFTSARREGTTLSPLLQRLGHDWARTVLDGSQDADRGLFLRDLFREVIVGDRDLALPRARVGRRTQRWIVGTAATLAILAGVAWGLSFVDLLRGIRSLTNEAGSVVAGASGLEAVDRLRAAIAGQSEEQPPLRGLGLGKGLGVALGRARETFLWAFEREFEEPTKDRLIGDVLSFDEDSFQALAALALDVRWLQVRGDPTLAARPPLLAYAPVGRNEADVAAFRSGYDAFVRWVPNRAVESRIESEREALDVAGPRLLDLTQLDAWSERNPEDLPPLRYADLGIQESEGGTVQVLGAYTLRGWKDLVKSLIDAVERTGTAPEAVTRFREGYVKRFDRSWRDFLMDTPTAPLPDPDVKSSPYLELVERIDRNTFAELERSGSAPEWMGALHRVRSEEAGEEEEAAPPWTSYLGALDQVEAQVATTEGSGERALDLATKLSEPEATEFGPALALVRELVSTPDAADRRDVPEPETLAKLREVLSIPVLNGASAVLDTAMTEVDRRWRDQIAVPFGGELDTQEIIAFYGPGGNLSRFLSDTLAPFYADGRARDVLADRQLPLGPESLAWLSSAEAVGDRLFPGSGGAPRISVRLEGVPSQVIGSSGHFVTRRVLRVACEDGVQSFDYREGTGAFAFTWSPDCQHVELRTWARRPGEAEVELLPSREWGGPFAFPRFLQKAQRLPGNRFQWRLEYPGQGVELVAEYRLRAGDAILEIAHRPPPRSLRN